MLFAVFRGEKGLEHRELCAVVRANLDALSAGIVGLIVMVLKKPIPCKKIKTHDVVFKTV
jgi:hypothetical protein